MLRSALIGLVAGARAITPFAAVAVAANRSELPDQDAAVRLLGHPIVAAGATALAVAEMAGDKLESAPDRIDPRGIAARVATAGIAGAALAPRDRRIAGALIAVTTATLSAYYTFSLRMGAMQRHSKNATGFIEDALVLGSTAALVHRPKAA